MASRAAGQTKPRTIALSWFFSRASVSPPLPLLTVVRGALSKAVAGPQPHARMAFDKRAEAPPTLECGPIGGAAYLRHNSRACSFERRELQFVSLRPLPLSGVHL